MRGLSGPGPCDLCPAIANSHVFIGNAHYVIGDLRAWGWVTLIIAALQQVAAGGVLMGNQLARLAMMACSASLAGASPCHSRIPWL